jgi:hypothetical protein
VASALAQRLVGRSRRHQCRHQPEHQAGSKRDQHGECDNGKIERDLVQSRHWNPIGDERQQAAMERERQREPGDAAGRCEQHAFREHLPNQPATLCTEGGTQAQLTLPHRASCQKQIGDIHAGDQQHEADRAGQQEHGRANVVHHLLVDRDERDRPAGIASRRFLFELRHDCLHVVSRLGERHTRA